MKIGIGILVVTLSLVGFAAAGPKKGGSALKETRPGATKIWHLANRWPESLTASRISSGQRAVSFVQAMAAMPTA